MLNLQKFNEHKKEWHLSGLGLISAYPKGYMVCTEHRLLERIKWKVKAGLGVMYHVQASVKFKCIAMASVSLNTHTCSPRNILPIVGYIDYI